MKVTWPQAAVIVAALVVLGFLAYEKVDASAITTVVLVVLAGFGYTSLRSVSDTQKETNEAVAGLHDRLDQIGTDAK